MSTKKGERKDLVISGPGAADFLAAQGGLDTPESGTKGMAATKEESSLVDPSRLQPALEPPPEERAHEREIVTPEDLPEHDTRNDE